MTRQLVSTFGADLCCAMELPDLPALVFADTVRFEALGVEGVLWRSRRVSWDGMRDFRREGFVLRGEAWEPSDRWYPFEVDLRSGNVAGGSYSEPPPAKPVRWWRRLTRQ